MKTILLNLSILRILQWCFRPGRRLTAQDLNLNGTIDLAGPDRVTSNANEFVQIEGDWYRESRSYTFPETNSATALLTGTQRQRLTGLGSPFEETGTF